MQIASVRIYSSFICLINRSGFNLIDLLCHIDFQSSRTNLNRWHYTVFVSNQRSVSISYVIGFGECLLNKSKTMSIFYVTHLDYASVHSESKTRFVLNVEKLWQMFWLWKSIWTTIEFYRHPHTMTEIDSVYECWSFQFSHFPWCGMLTLSIQFIPVACIANLSLFKLHHFKSTKLRQYSY